MPSRAVFAFLLVASLSLPAIGAATDDTKPRSFSEDAVRALDDHTAPADDPPPRPATIISVGSDLGEIALDPTRPRAYVADRQNDRVLVVATDSASLSATVPVRDQPVGLAINPSASHLYVAHAGTGTVSEIDLVSLAVTRNFTVPFLPWKLAASTDGQLLVTTHDMGYSGQYPYVLNLSDGSTAERLNPGELVYTDALIALSPDGDTVYVGNSIAPFLFYVFAKSGDRWVFQRKGPDFGSGTPSISDIAVSADGTMLYFSKWGGAPSRIASDYTFSGPVGSYSASWSVAVSPSGQFLALSAGDAAVRIVDLSDRFYAPEVQALAVPESVERVRVTPDGTKIVATEGFTVDSWQDIAVLDVPEITSVVPGSPLGVQPVPPSVVRASVRSFRSLATLTVEMALDGAPIPSSLEPGTGTVQGTPPPLADGDHTVLVRALRAGVEVARTTWTFSLVSERAWYVHSVGDYRIQVPAGWTPREGSQPPEIVDVFISAPQGDVGLAVLAEYAEPSESARQVLDEHLAERSTYPGFLLLEPVSDQTLDGHPAASAFFRHFLAEGPAYQQLVAVADRGWGMDWLLVGAMNTPTSLGFRTLVNETIDSFDILEPPPPERWFSHSARHFRIRMPRNWTASGDTTVGGAPVDVLLQSTGRTSIVVASEARSTTGSATGARSILQETLDELDTLPGFRVIEPVNDLTIDGRNAARATVVTEPQTYQEVYQAIVVVVGPEWGLAWGLIATMDRWEWPAFRGLANATLSSFDPEGSPAAPFEMPFLVIVGVGVTGILAAIITVVILRRGRRARTSDPVGVVSSDDSGTHPP